MVDDGEHFDERVRAKVGHVHHLRLPQLLLTRLRPDLFLMGFILYLFFFVIYIPGVFLIYNSSSIFRVCSSSIILYLCCGVIFHL